MIKKTLKDLPVVPPVVPPVNWRRLQNREIRQYVYRHKLSSTFEALWGKEMRYASRSEIADFLTALSD